jgi:ATP-binding cassette subfamily B protein
MNAHEEDDTYSGSLDWALWRRIARHARPYRRTLGGLIASGVVLAAIDAAFPLITGALIDEVVAHGLSPRLKRLGGGYVALFVALCAAIWALIRFAGKIATGLGFDLRQRGFARLQELSFSYYDTRSVGWLVTRLTSDTAKLSDLLPWFLVEFSWGPALLVGVVAGMLSLSPPLALVVLLIVPPLAIVSYAFQRRLLESSRLMRKTNSQMTSSFSESIAGVRTTKALVRERENLAEFQTLSRGMWEHSMRNALQSAVYLPMVMLLGSVGVGLALWRGGVELNDGLTYGTLVAFMQYAALFSMPIQDMARRFAELQAAQAAAERVQSLLDEVPQIADDDEVRARVSQAPDPATGLARDGYRARIGTMEFRDVSFAYKPGEPVLRDFHLTVRAGETVALVGATGGGKSPIVSLAARFYEPTEGSILVDGVDLRRRSLHWLQSSLGVVLQTPHLFRGSVRENIRYGRLDASDDEVEAAARRANAHPFIAALDDGYESEVGEAGAKLSTGQRQLVSLARAVLAEPQIFILDEATSSVDTETERLIQAGIDEALRGRIAFVIAHRLSTIEGADHILVIDGGQVVEQGDHASLMRRGGRYRRLVERQWVRERSSRALSA